MADLQDSPLKTQVREQNPLNQQEEEQQLNPMQEEDNYPQQEPMQEQINQQFQQPMQEQINQQFQQPMQQPMQLPMQQPMQYPINQGQVPLPMPIPLGGLVQYLPQSLEEAMLQIQIPNSVSFEHTLKFKDACCESIEISEISQIPGLGNGIFKVGGHLRTCKCSIPLLSCLCRPSGNCCSICDCLYCLRCDYEYSHLYKGPIYTISNEMIRFEHFGLISKVFVRNVLALEIYESDYNNADIYFGACCSNYPHLIIKNPNFIGNEYIYFEPQPNDCPEHPCAYIPGSCVICSWIGIKQLFRSIRIEFQYGEDSSDKSCKIQTIRTTKQACKKQCGNCSDDVVDYPKTEIKFSQSVTQLERLGIVMASIHHSIFNRWVQYGWLGKFYTNIPQFYLDEQEF